MKLRTAQRWRNLFLFAALGVLASAVFRFVGYGESLHTASLSHLTFVLAAIGAFFLPVIALQPWIATFLYNAISELGPYYQARLKRNVVSILAIDEYKSSES